MTPGIGKSIDRQINETNRESGNRTAYVRQQRHKDNSMVKGKFFSADSAVPTGYPYVKNELQYEPYHI